MTFSGHELDELTSSDLSEVSGGVGATEAARAGETCKTPTPPTPVPMPYPIEGWGSRQS